METDWMALKYGWWISVGKTCFWAVVLLLVGLASGFVKLSLGAYTPAGFEWQTLPGGAVIAMGLLAAIVIGAWNSGYLVVTTAGHFAELKKKYDEASGRAWMKAMKYREMMDSGIIPSPGGLGAWEVVSRTPGEEEVKVTFRVEKLVPMDGEHWIQPPAGYGHNGFRVKDAAKIAALKETFKKRPTYQPVWVTAILKRGQLLDAQTPLLGDEQWWGTPHEVFASAFDWQRW